MVQKNILRVFIIVWPAKSSFSQVDVLNKCYDLFRVSQWGCPQLLVAPRAWCSGPWCPLVCGAGAPTWEVGAGGVQRLQTLQVAVAALAVLLQGALLLVAPPAVAALVGLPYGRGGHWTRGGGGGVF